MRRPTQHVYVEACITPVSFPNTQAELLDMLEPTEEGCLDTHLQELVAASGDPTYEGGWTVPRWMTEGDVLLFYHAKNALRRIQRIGTELLRDVGGDAALASEDELEIFGILLDERDLAERYGGAIFACAHIGGRPAIDGSADERARQKHWRGRVYAPIRDLHVFARPLPDSEFGRYVTLSKTGGPTPLRGAAFDDVRDALGRHNRLPAYFANARSGGASFWDVTAATWRSISCRPDTRFIDETQVRKYFADYLLTEIKDPRTPLLEECVCGHGNQGPTADYLVRVEGVWVPVEAKLNVLTEGHLIEQIARYVEAEVFTPKLGQRRGRTVVGPTAGTCLIIDAEGLYAASAVGFTHGEPGRPFVTREQVAHLNTGELRTRLSSILARSA